MESTKCRMRSAYGSYVFCETFYSGEDGWRECKMCMKRIHCGCIASRYLHEYMDVGGVCCRSCVKSLEMHLVQPMQVQGDIPKDTFVINVVRVNGTRDIRHVLPFSVGFPEKDEQNKSSSRNSNNTQASVSRPRVPKPPAKRMESNQLKSRYLPKISAQELTQISEELKSTIIPLFEKILTASDTGKFGHMVLPKACIEAYFPFINQSEGIPISILDIKEKKWEFHFGCWPNRNSRMYALEGVTPYLKAMQLQVGDTVTFNRLDPGGQLVIGCRKATELRFPCIEAQDMLRPSPNSEPAIVTVDEHEFEELKVMKHLWSCLSSYECCS